MYGSTVSGNSRVNVITTGIECKMLRKMASCRLLDRPLANQLIQSVDNFMFDCDGVLWNGPKSLPGTVETVEKLRKLGKRIYLVTNNSTKSRRQYIKKCQQLGFSIKEEEMVCTAFVAAQYLHNIDFKGKIYLVGESGVGEELDKFGFSYTGIGPDTVKGDVTDWTETELDPQINCVLVSFDRHISFPKVLKAASYARRKDSIFLATNEDSHLPCDGEVTVPGTGTIVGPVKLAARREPIVLGKPNKHMFKILEETFKLDPVRTVMVGDRIDTDIQMAHNCGLKSLLVLTGVSNLEDVKSATQSPDPSRKACVPDFYLQKLSDLLTLLEN